jgi:hypothetical protein
MLQEGLFKRNRSTNRRLSVFRWTDWFKETARFPLRLGDVRLRTGPARPGLLQLVGCRSHFAQHRIIVAEALFVLSSISFLTQDPTISARLIGKKM